MYNEVKGKERQMRNIALVVDDVELNREILTEMLEDDYRIVEAENGAEALKLIDQYDKEIAVILLDLVMPEVTGIEVLERLHADGRIEKYPILIISGETDPGIEEKCLSLGVSDFIKKPFNSVLVKHRVKNSEALTSSRYHLEEKVAEQTEKLREQAESLKIKNNQLEEMNDRTIELLATVVEARSLESGTHVKRVKGFTRILAETMLEKYPECGLDEHSINTIESASSMHDVGKIMISDAVLNKPGKLTPEEFDYMKTHTIRGCEVLENSRYMWEEDYYRYCWDICRYHHEKWDGRGYPEGLKGDEIPLSAQLVSVADCYDALTTERVYKRAFSNDEAYEMITTGQCGEFSPKILDCLHACRESFAEYANRNKSIIKS